MNQKLIAQIGKSQRLQIITGDLVEEHQPPWVANIAENLAELTDGISIHAYWDYRDTAKLIGRLSKTSTASAQPSDRKRSPTFQVPSGKTRIHTRTGARACSAAAFSPSL